MLQCADAASCQSYLHWMASRARAGTGIQNIRNRWQRVVMLMASKVGRKLDADTRKMVNTVASIYYDVQRVD